MGRPVIGFVFLSPFVRPVVRPVARLVARFGCRSSSVRSFRLVVSRRRYRPPLSVMSVRPSVLRLHHGAEKQTDYEERATAGSSSGGVFVSGGRTACSGRNAEVRTACLRKEHRCKDSLLPMIFAANPDK